MPQPRDLPVGATVLLCDADGNLFGSEEPAFAASTSVTNAFLERLGSARRWEAAELQQVALGRNFRALASDLLVEEGVEVDEEELALWVELERVVVTRRLRDTLRVDPAVSAPLERLSRSWRLALVSSSALARLDACLDVAGLVDLFPLDRRYSAQDSLPVPTSKPDPAVYLAALEGLGLRPGDALAVEDAVSGVRSAVGAGIAVVGNLAFVPDAEHEERTDALLAAGAAHVVADWSGLERLLGTRQHPRVEEVGA